MHAFFYQISFANTFVCKGVNVDLPRRGALGHLVANLGPGLRFVNSEPLSRFLLTLSKSSLKAFADFGEVRVKWPGRDYTSSCLAPPCLTGVFMDWSQLFL